MAKTSAWDDPDRPADVMVGAGEDDDTPATVITRKSSRAAAPQEAPPDDVAERVDAAPEGDGSFKGAQEDGDGKVRLGRRFENRPHVDAVAARLNAAARAPAPPVQEEASDGEIEEAETPPVTPAPTKPSGADPDGAVRPSVQRLKELQQRRAQREQERRTAEVEEKHRDLLGFEKVKELAATDAVGLLNLLGLDPRKDGARIVKELVAANDPNQLRLMQLERQVAQERVAREQAETRIRDEQAAREAQREIDDAKADIRDLVDGDARFELVRADGAYDRVWQTVEKHYRDTGEVLEFEDAAQLVEDDITARADRLLRTQRMAGRAKAPAKDGGRANPPRQPAPVRKPPTVPPANNAATQIPNLEGARRQGIRLGVSRDSQHVNDAVGAFLKREGFSN